jgi:hypothetical protein
LLLYHTIFYAGNFVIIYFTYKNVLLDKKDDQEKLFEWLKKEGITGRKILSIPGDCNTIVYKTDNAVLCPPANFTNISVNQYKTIWEEYDWPNRNIQKLIEDYDLDFIIVSKKALDYAFKKGWNYDLSRYTKVFETDRFAVYNSHARSDPKWIKS